VSLARLREAVGRPIELPEGEAGTYHTLGGLVMARLGRVPHAGDRFAFSGFRFEVLDMDRQRVDKVLVQTEPAGRCDGNAASAAGGVFSSPCYLTRVAPNALRPLSRADAGAAVGTPIEPAQTGRRQQCQRWRYFARDGRSIGVFVRQ
jgi:hypothetical protein